MTRPRVERKSSAEQIRADEAAGDGDQQPLGFEAAPSAASSRAATPAWAANARPALPGVNGPSPARTSASRRRRSGRGPIRPSGAATAASKVSATTSMTTWAGESQTKARAPTAWMTAWTSTALENVRAAHRAYAARRWGDMYEFFGLGYSPDPFGGCERCRRRPGHIHRPPTQSPAERAMYTARPSAFESTDTVSRVVALLVRFPAIHSVRSNPAEATLTLSFAVRERFDRTKTQALADRVSEYVRAFLDLRGEVPAKIAVASDHDAAVSFVHVTRDAASFAREELELLVALFADAYGDRLVRRGERPAGGRRSGCPRRRGRGGSRCAARPDPAAAPRRLPGRATRAGLLRARSQARES